MGEIYGVRTAFQEGGENDPVNQMASYHIDLASSNFGIQEENHFPTRSARHVPRHGRDSEGVSL